MKINKDDRSCCGEYDDFGSFTTNVYDNFSQFIYDVS